MLTDDDRGRLREEMVLREEMRRELSRPSEGAKLGIRSFLNSPFFITVIAGFAISVVGHLFVRTNAEYARERAAEGAIRDKKMAVTSALANDLSTYIGMKGSFLKRKIWLNSHRDESAMRDGATRADVQKEYFDIWKLMMQARKPDAVLAEVRSFFASPEVIDDADKVESAIAALDEAKTEADVEPLAKEQEKSRRELVRAMGRELRGVGQPE